MKKLLPSGVTLLELLVVVLILAILSSIAVGVYTKEVVRARYARTRAEIKTLEIAVNRYQIDTGQFPPSSSGVILSPGDIDMTAPATGCGFLQVALRASLNGNASTPLDTRWMGPYVEWDYNKLGDLTGGPITSGLAKPQMQFLDPFGTPYLYLRHEEYDGWGGTRLPSTDPYAATETYYNPSTFQIISYGSDKVSDATAPLDSRGLDPDDVTNFQGSQY